MTNITTTRQQIPDLLRRMLARGDAVSIERGRLIIQLASGKPIPEDMFQQYAPELIQQILRGVGTDAFQYLSHKAENNDGKYPGLTLQLQSVVTEAKAYTIFNVELTRARNTPAGKKGGRLPEGQFRIGKNHDLYRFWLSTGLPLPRRLAALHDYIGNLRGILLTAIPTAGHNGTRLQSKTLMPLHLPASVIRRAVLPDNCQTTPRQAAGNSRTRLPDKESAPAQQPRGLQPFPSTGEENHGKAVIRRSGNAGVPAFTPARKKPEEQSVDEWLADYERPSPSP